MEYPSDELPAGAEACSISSRSNHNSQLDEPIKMSDNQIAAGIQFLINKNKRKSQFTNDEQFFINEFKAVEPVILDSATEMEALLEEIKSNFTFNKTVTLQVVNSFKTLRGLVFGHGKDDRLTEVLLEGLKSLLDFFKQFLKDTRGQIVRECCVLIGFMSLLMGRSADVIVENLFNHLNALISSKQRDVPGLAEATLRWIYWIGQVLKFFT